LFNSPMVDKKTRCCFLMSTNGQFSNGMSMI
jgi:hypothetical protein